MTAKSNHWAAQQERGNRLLLGLTTLMVRHLKLPAVKKEADAGSTPETGFTILQKMCQRGLTADVLRHPKAEINLLLEVMLGAADATLLAGDYQQANVILNSIERVLESGTVMDPLAKSYEEIVNKTVTMGFEVQRIEMRFSRLRRDALRRRRSNRRSPCGRCGPETGSRLSVGGEGDRKANLALPVSRHSAGKSGGDAVAHE